MGVEFSAGAKWMIAGASVNISNEAMQWSLAGAAVISWYSGYMSVHFPRLDVYLRFGQTISGP